MDPTYWHRQAADKPLFEELVWSKPENKRSAGKLLILGGNAHGVSAPAFAYQAATRAGIGTARVLLPDAIQKTIGKSFSEGEFAFSTPSGSFAKTAVNQILENTEWADALLLSGDLGHNSETAILIEQLLDKYHGLTTLTQDALDYYINDVGQLTHRDNTLMVTNLGRLQKMTRAGMPSLIIQHSMSLHALVGLLNSWSRESKTRILTYHSGNFVYADGGQVSTTSKEEIKDWEVPLAAFAATWWLQHPTKSFEAITTAVHDFVSNY
jgi:hypothetical protein